MKNYYIINHYCLNNLRALNLSISLLLQLLFNHFYHDVAKNSAFLEELSRDPAKLMEDLEMEIPDNEMTEEFGEKNTLINNGENHAIPATSTRLPQDTCAPRAPRRTFGAPRVAGTEAPLQVLQRLEQEIPFLLVDATTTLQATPDSAQQAYARGILRKYAEYEKLLDTILLRDVPGSVNDAGSDRALAQAIFISLLSALDSIKNACDSIINSGNMSTPRPFGDQPPHAGWFHYLIMICILSLSCCLYNM